ncbi:UNVERIFIED_CONTAM: putative mitochondrial protein [Sesamum calycinum]|uniref:Mitochondrial protein n=1 Tax=Sesamum calycinum TaxID=2727403 RepID=A0AAW2QKN6_9LAMI
MKAQGGLGFRRLKELNEALLAKQAWRVAMNPDSLMHLVLQQKYFPNSSFYNANFGTASSYTWRSLVWSRDILHYKTCLRWKVGDGQSLTIKGMPLPKPHSFQLIFQPRTLTGDAKVAELINGNGWDEGLIISEFDPCDASCILSIKLPKSNARDVLVWHYEKSGKFSVRGAYSLAVIWRTKQTRLYKLGIGPSSGKFEFVQKYSCLHGDYVLIPWLP